MKYRGYELMVSSDLLDDAEQTVYTGVLLKNGIPVAYVYDCPSVKDVRAEAKDLVDEMLEGEDE